MLFIDELVVQKGDKDNYAAGCSAANAVLIVGGSVDLLIAVLARLHIERQRVNMGNIFSGCFSRVGRDAEASGNGEGVGGAANRLLGDSV